LHFNVEGVSGSELDLVDTWVGGGGGEIESKSVQYFSK